jgi:hypothetical protein
MLDADDGEVGTCVGRNKNKVFAHECNQCVAHGCVEVVVVIVIDEFWKFSTF